MCSFALYSERGRSAVPKWASEARQERNTPREAQQRPIARAGRKIEASKIVERKTQHPWQRSRLATAVEGSIAAEESAAAKKEEAAVKQPSVLD